MTFPVPGIGLGIGVTDICQIALVLNMDGHQGRQTQILKITSPGRGPSAQRSMAQGNRQPLSLSSWSSLRMRWLQGEAPVQMRVDIGGPWGLGALKSRAFDFSLTNAAFH